MRTARVAKVRQSLHDRTLSPATDPMTKREVFRP
jgi:hypothetical protein